MLTINKSDYTNMVYMEVDGGLTKEDTEKADAFLSEHYGDSAEINADGETQPGNRRIQPAVKSGRHIFSEV